MDIHITVGPATEGGWRCVDDAGRPVFLPRGALDAGVRDLRVGQRVRVGVVDGAVVGASLT